MKPQDKTTSRRFTLVLAILLIISALGIVPCITIDGKSYYLQMRSIILGGDASYYDEVMYHYEGYQPDYLIAEFLPSGYVANLFPLGFAVILTPFFLLGHGLAVLFNGLGWGPPPTGYTYPEVLLTLLASAGLGSLGIGLSAMIARRFYGIKAALWATLGLGLASPLPGYIYAQPSFAHSLSVLTSCIVLIIWLSGRGIQLNAPTMEIGKRGLALGLAIGLATLVRWQDGTFLILPLFDLMRSWKLWKFRGSAWYILPMGLGFIVAVFPQLLLWKIQFGNWVTIPQGQGFMRWWDPQILAVLFGARHGLISWTPIMAIPMLGILGMANRKPAVGLPLLALLIIQIYVNSVVLDWWAGWGFGGRRFLDMVPFFILATAFLFQELPEWAKKLVPFGVGALIIWNASLLYHYFTGHVDFGGNVPFMDWCRQNWKLLIHKPLLAVGGMVVIAGILWGIHHWVHAESQPSRFSPFRSPRLPGGKKLGGIPATWVMVAVMAYLALWSLNLARTTINIQSIEVLNPEFHYREWTRVVYRPPFQGCGLNDIATPDTPWKQFASWSVKPGGTWKIVTACEGNLSQGDIAAVLTVEEVGGQRLEEALRWGIATGPVQVSATSSWVKDPGATISRLEPPPEIKAAPYRTFQPLPWYIAGWIRFITDYSGGRIPLDAAYEYTFALPDSFTPKSFELQPKEAGQCVIYGIGRVEDTRNGR